MVYAMEELQQLTNQVKILTETVQTMIARFEQLYKMQEERAQTLVDSATNLQQTRDNLEVTNEALTNALNEVDRQVDDLATVTAGLLALKAQTQTEQQTQ